MRKAIYPIYSEPAKKGLHSSRRTPLSTPPCKLLLWTIRPPTMHNPSSTAPTVDHVQFYTLDFNSLPRLQALQSPVLPSSQEETEEPGFAGLYSQSPGT